MYPTSPPYSGVVGHDLPTAHGPIWGPWGPGLGGPSSAGSESAAGSDGGSGVGGSVGGGGGDHGRASSMSEQSTTRSVSDILASDGEEQGQDGKLRTDLPATLCAELDAFMHFRTQPLNQMRASVSHCIPYI